MKEKYYEKIITWDQKPDYFGMFCCLAFIGMGIAMCFLALYEYGVPVRWWILLGIFILMTLFGLSKIGETLPQGRKVRYIQVK